MRKGIILAGGLGTRISEETILKPKPMLEIGSMPLIWHIMKIYEHYGINEFIVCIGYRGFDLINFFLNYKFKNSDLNIDLLNDKLKIYSKTKEKFNITFCETGEDTGTAGRLKIASKYIEIITITVNDGVSKKVDYINYKEFSNNECVYKENTEIISQDYLKALSSWPTYKL